MVKKVSIWSSLIPLLYSDMKHLADISRELKKPHTTVRKQLNIFEKLGILTKNVIGRQTFYKIKNHQLIIDYLTIVEKERLVKRCKQYLILKELVEFIHSKFNNDVLIFGSAVYLTNPNDIDILIIGNFPKNDMKNIKKKLNIHLHIINVKQLSQINKSLKEEIKKFHLMVQGSERLIKWLIS